MLVTLAGAMSPAELGRSLAEMIRRGKVHAICSTGANLEEDLFNLVAHDHYVRLPNYRELSAREEKELEQRGLNRVTDTCIPEVEAFRAIEKPILELWRRAEAAGKRHLPYEYLYQLIREGWVRDHYQIDPALSWLVAAAEADLPIFVPGWEDSTLGNIFVSHVLSGDLASYGAVKSGLETMGALAVRMVRAQHDGGRSRRPARARGEARRGVGRAARDPAEPGAAHRRLLPDRRRHRGRLSDLRRADDPPGPAPALPVLGLLLPDQ